VAEGASELEQLAIVEAQTRRHCSLDNIAERAVTSALHAVAELAPSGSMAQPSNQLLVLGVIAGNRGFFPDHLARR
jgi:hypothetical protein